ncbi:folylpolyglutamate synthase-like isoform X2 [Selaginella moellendorffii]|uniref:folylpolyglutamate synthase-like isoform X2 n=1 Tax=Selaginella moellendorffii TaxID=88036 RepID=UPI000D1CC0B6|nr:folylpolyglutamate synthase-like isoform X2 [Selaginella moellendorffii]|eukprot:XP_024542135.1 folylpolyglutamate synthase-like isoform X2 [Selaginella moellendorffii]
MELRSSSPEASREALTSLITRRYRIAGPNETVQLMGDYLKILQLEEPLKKLSVIHVAGTKGKGSTCAFSESILRACGYKTGLFTSPHLVDVRERFRFNGTEVSETLFQEYFWWCWDRLQEGCTSSLPMPSYFRFLTLLAFKMFTSEKIDVAILEVGLGGKYDPTNVIETPDVCGITSLGFDHMEILGHTLPEIAGEKAGILKPGVSAYTSPQREDAMAVLQARAADLSIPLQVVHPLADTGNLELGLKGDHQLVNAALAVSLCKHWIKKSGIDEAMGNDDLPDAFKTGLASAQLLGRAQIERDLENLMLYLDGAHSPESMEVCGNWFSKAVKSSRQKTPKQIMVFNCMPERDPAILFPSLLNACHGQGVRIDKAVFVSNSHGTPTSDLKWQRYLQKCWDSLQSPAGRDEFCNPVATQEEGEEAVSTTEYSMVIPSPGVALNFLRRLARSCPSFSVNVLVTGSLHLVGDVLNLLKR